MTDHPAPWQIDWTSFGQSMGYDSRSRIIDANGRHVITIGSGANTTITQDEALARRIVEAINHTETTNVGQTDGTED